MKLIYKFSISPHKKQVELLSKYITTILITLISSCNLIAQDRENDTEWRPLYDTLVQHYQARNKDSVDCYAETIFVSKKEQIHDSLRVIIGAMLAKLSEEETEAFKYLAVTEAKLINSKKNKNLLGWTYFHKAAWYFHNFHDKKALSYYYKADSVFTAIHRISFMAAMTKVGICDVLMKSELNKNELIMNQVLPHIEEGLRISDSIGHPIPSAIFWYKKGILYFTKGDLENAVRCYRKSLAISNTINNDVRRAMVFNRLAKVFLKRNLLDSAIIYQEKAVEKAKNITDLKIISEVNLALGITYNKIKNYDGAIQHLAYAKELFKKSNLIRKEPYHDIEYHLAEAYFGKGKFKKGYTYLKSAKKSMEEAQQVKNAERVEEIEAKYQTDKKEQEITLLKAQNQLVEQQKTSQRYVFLGSIAVTSMIGFFFFFLYHNRQKTTKKLQALDKVRSTFFTNISHEFRTPLTMISGPLQSQLQKEDLKAEEQATFEMMYRNTTRLLALVDQLLDISKIEAGRLPLKIAKNNILAFIGMLADGFTFIAAQKQITYTVQQHVSEVDAYFDADVLEKIVVNLLSNAIKYTPKKGAIICKATVQKEELHFTIKNTGKTLSKKDITHIFERFYQINEDAQGVGIGLALVKELVVLHKGFIKVESTPNEWTTFKVVLPINKNSFTKDEFAPLDASQKVEQKTNTYQSVIDEKIINTIDKEAETPVLLIVDDNADIRTYVSSLFKNNYKVLAAKNGQEGINIAIKQVPNIIISDIMMPVRNGIYLCNQLKNDERTSHIPIILLTAKAGEENEIEGIKTGADDYVTKPFSEQLLKIRVEKLIENRKKLQLRYSRKVVLKPKDIAITSVDEQFLERLQKILDHKLTDASFTIQDFCQTIGMSRMQLHRKLKALTGLSTSAFIRSERLKLAAQLLKTAKINISEVCYTVGFNDHAYFSKCFKKQYDCTPTEYVQTSQNAT